MSIELVMPSSHLILCCPLLLLPSVFPSIRVFSNESALHIRRPKYWSFSFNISPSKEHSVLISFRMDWLDLLAVQGTLKSLLQHHSSKASVLQRSAFFIVQLSHPYMTPGKTIALTRQTFVGKVMSLLFNMLSRLCNTLSNPYCSNLPESCSYEGRVFQDGEDWPLSRCAKCVCRNGVAQCFAAQCPPLFCNQVRKTASEDPSQTVNFTIWEPGVSSEMMAGRPCKY